MDTTHNNWLVPHSLPNTHHNDLSTDFNDNPVTQLYTCLLNTRSVANKLSKFQGFVYSSDFSIVCITETWLNSDIFDNEILPSGYSIYRKDRDSRGGGVLLAIKDSISSSRLPSPSDIETVTLQFLFLHRTQ